jgi:TP901 family phage tail tape measure protein
MPDASTILTYTLQPAPGTEAAVKRHMTQLEKAIKFNTPFSLATRNTRDFISELERANQRVITLGLAFQTLRSSQQILSGIVRSTIEVEKAFTEINAVFGLTSKNLDKFGKELFNVARDTSQSFQKASEAAKEFSRQGLSAEETLKRTKSALTLSRVAAMDVAESVNVLTASMNGFSKAGLTAQDITNKLLAVDTRFAVSAGDLAQALARAGASASDAGVQFDQLIGIVTAVQQTTARGGAVIGNALKTIFTRIERKDTIEALEALGVQVRNVNGSVKPAMDLLRNFASMYDHLGDAAKKSAAEVVGGVYQINILKAALGDLANANSIYAQAVKTAGTARNEELIRNEAMNKSLDATLERLGLMAKQVGSNIGGLGFSGFARGMANIGLDNFITKSLEDASGQAETIGGQMAEMFIRGFGNAILMGLGPMLAVGLSRASAYTFRKLGTDLSDITGMSGAQKAIRSRTPRMAGGYIPFAEESAAISAGVGGARSGARPVLLPSFKFGDGKSGPIVANSSEFVVPNFAHGGSAIFNPEMIRRYGLPPGATPVAAGGYIPNMAVGGMPDFPSVDIYGIGDRGAGGRFLPKNTVSEVNYLMSMLRQSTSGGEAREFAKRIGEISNTFSKVARENVLEKVGKSLSIFDSASSAIAKRPLRSSVEVVLGGVTSAPNAYEASMKRAAIERKIREDAEVQRILSANVIRSGPPSLSMLPERKEPWFKNAEHLRGLGMIGAFGAPMAAGFIDEAGGGTSSGMNRGALRGGLMGMGFGASVGTMIPHPLGVPLGMAAGALGGGAYGFLDKMSESFEEMAKRLDEVSKTMNKEVDSVIKVLAMAAEIRTARLEGQNQRANRLETERKKLISGIRDPQYLKFVEENYGKDKAADRFGEIAIPKIAKQEIFASTMGGLKKAEMGLIDKAIEFLFPAGTALRSKTAFPVIGGARVSLGGTTTQFAERAPQLDMEEMAKLAESFVPLLSSFKENYLTLLSKISVKDPQKALRSALAAGGYTEKDIGEFLKDADFNKIKAILGIAIPEAAKRGRVAQDTNLGSIGEGMITPTQAYDMSRAYGASASAFALRSGANRQISTARNRIALENPALTDMGRLSLERDLERRRIEKDIADQRRDTIERGMEGLTGKAKDLGTPAIFAAIQNLGGSSTILQDLEALKKSSTDMGLKGAIDELSASLVNLNIKKKEEIRTVEEINAAQRAQLKFRMSYAGAMAEDTGMVRSSAQAYNASIRRNDAPSVIADKRRAAQLAKLMRQRRRGLATEGDVESFKLIGGLEQTDEQAILRENAILSNLGNPLVDGSMTSGALMGRAGRSGRGGNALGSLSGGFGSVFAGLKQDMMDLSSLGQNLANTLQNSLGNAWGDFVTGAKSAKDAFRDFAVSIMGDASRALGSKALQGILGSMLGGFGFNSGGAVGFAMGGKVPALLTGGEYVLGPNAAKSVGYDTLRKLNRYADGGVVRGGSGVKDDVPAKLPPGSFVVRKSAVNRLGVDYLDSLASGGVQRRFLGGFLGLPMLYGALAGGGLGYLAGGKKGAIGGALLGGIGGGLYGMNNASIGGDGMAHLSLNTTETAALGLGASAGLGLLASGIGSPKSSSGAISNAQIPAYARQLEAEQADLMSKNRFAYLQTNPQGGYSLGSFGAAPATRRWASGGEVSSFGPSPRGWADGGEVGAVDTALSIGPRNSGGSTPAVSVKIEINNNGNGQATSKSSSTGGSDGGGFGADFGSKIEKAVRPIVQDEIVRQMRNDGIFSQKSRYMNG